MAGIYHQAGCCCINPCTYCGEDDSEPPVDYVQPNVVVTEDAPAGDCNAGGTYVWAAHTGLDVHGTYCLWEWTYQPNPPNWPMFYLRVLYYPATNKYICRIERQDATWGTTPYIDDPCTDITCNKATHELEGAVTMIGQPQVPLTDCTPYTATCTFGV